MKRDERYVKKYHSKWNGRDIMTRVRFITVCNHAIKHSFITISNILHEFVNTFFRPLITIDIGFSKGISIFI